MKKILFILISLMIFSFMGCSNKATGDEKKAEDYVKELGYKITARKGEVHKYTLEKNKLYGATETIPYQQMWAVQKEEPDQYFGKEIIIYCFKVKNHPLQKKDSHAKYGS